MGKAVKQVKVYLEDWRKLNLLVGELQALKGKRMSFADAINVLVKMNPLSVVLENMEKIEVVQ